MSLIKFHVSLWMLIIATAAAAALKPQFEVVELTNLPSQLRTYPAALRVNNSNQIAGATIVGSGGPHFESFIWQDGSVQLLGNGRIEDINDPGAYIGRALGSVFQPIEPSLKAYAINNDGQVVGEDNGRAFLWGSNGFAYFPTGQSVIHSTARAVNNFGLAVGEARVRFEPFHAFLFTVSNAVDIGNPPGTYQSEGKAITDQGHATVAVTHTNRLIKRIRSYLYREGQLTDLGSLPGKPHTLASAMNNSDEIVGFTGRTAPPVGTNMTFAITISAGFLYSGGKLYALNKLLTKRSRGWHIINAVDINDSGSIVALASRGPKAGQAVLLRRVTP